MASQLKDQFGPSVPRAIAAMIGAVHGTFPRRAFLRDALKGYQPLSLTARGAHIAAALQRHLPAEFPRAVEILVASATQPHAHKSGSGMSGFLYMPHLLFVARHGLDHFEESMRAQHALTQLFTAEFSIRAFIEAQPEKTMARLRQWATDPSPQVRRLVSEGTRPRLQIGARLRASTRIRAGHELLECSRDPSRTSPLRGQQPHRQRDQPELRVAIAGAGCGGAAAKRRGS